MKKASDHAGAARHPSSGGGEYRSTPCWIPIFNIQPISSTELASDSPPPEEGWPRQQPRTGWSGFFAVCGALLLVLIFSRLPSIGAQTAPATPETHNHRGVALMTQQNFEAAL